MVVSIGIALFLSVRLFAIGIVMALWSVGAIAVLPIIKGLKFLATSPRLRGRRRRAFAVVAGLVAVAWFILFVIPLPYATVAEGVIIVPDKAEVRAKTEGFVTKVIATPNTAVSPQQPLVSLDDPTLDAQVAVIAAQLERGPSASRRGAAARSRPGRNVRRSGQSTLPTSWRPSRPDTRI